MPTHTSSRGPSSFLVKKQEFFRRGRSVKFVKNNNNKRSPGQPVKPTSAGPLVLTSLFVLFYSRLGHRIDGRESGDQVQMRSFMPRLQKTEPPPSCCCCCCCGADGRREVREGEGSESQPYARDSSLMAPALLCLRAAFHSTNNADRHLNIYVVIQVI